MKRIVISTNATTNNTPNTEHKETVHQGRKLTDGEIALSKLIFGQDIDYEAVTLHAEKWYSGQDDGIAMTPFGAVYFGKLYRPDFSSADGQLKHTFIHEMAHVWQYQTGAMVAAKGIILGCGTGLSEIVNDVTPKKDGFLKKALGKTARAFDPYVYELSPTMKLTDYNMESQAEILADYFSTTYNKDLGISRENRDNLKYSFLYDKVLSDFFLQVEKSERRPRKISE